MAQRNPAEGQQEQSKCQPAPMPRLITRRGPTAREKMDALAVEAAIAQHFNYRQNIIVPNVFWGLGLWYEADIVVLRPSGWAVEVEIKVSAADIRRDLKKRSWAHQSELFRQLWFAVPEALADNENIPPQAGVLAICQSGTRHLWVKTKRPPKLNGAARRWTEAERQHLMHLGLMRIWSLKLAAWSKRNNELNRAV